MRYEVWAEYTWHDGKYETHKVAYVGNKFRKSTAEKIARDETIKSKTRMALRGGSSHTVYYVYDRWKKEATYPLS